ncbi:hypothetical protein PR048_000416 [Dryococelus australis]|uniref:Uncharacterized protein n=1 Tax=Dryococelus australis TaxID=614101 RepID=A0ABQ9IEK5_9NEOP|nr:hypothetical protein PR048_000416 [Dryococelus australis]
MPVGTYDGITKRAEKRMTAAFPNFSPNLETTTMSEARRKKKTIARVEVTQHDSSSSPSKFTELIVLQGAVSARNRCEHVGETFDKAACDCELLGLCRTRVRVSTRRYLRWSCVWHAPCGPRGSHNDTFAALLITLVKLPTSYPVEPSSISGGGAPGFSQVIIGPGDAAGRRDFSGISRFPPPFRSGAAPFSPRFTPVGFEDLAVNMTLFPFSPTLQFSYKYWPRDYHIELFELCILSIMSPDSTEFYGVCHHVATSTFFEDTGKETLLRQQFPQRSMQRNITKRSRCCVNRYADACKIRVIFPPENRFRCLINKRTQSVVSPGHCTLVDVVNLLHFLKRD